VFFCLKKDFTVGRASFLLSTSLSNMAKHRKRDRSPSTSSSSGSNSESDASSASENRNSGRKRGRPTHEETQQANRYKICLADDWFCTHTVHAIAQMQQLFCSINFPEPQHCLAAAVVLTQQRLPCQHVLQCTGMLC
jgi:hypothetical protein